MSVAGRAYAASGGHDGVVNLWSLETGKRVCAHEGQGRIVRAEMNADGLRMVATSFGVVEVVELKYNNSSSNGR